MKRLGLILLILVIIGFLTRDVWVKKENLKQDIRSSEEGSVNEFENVQQYKVINCPEITSIKNKTIQGEINRNNKVIIDRIVADENMKDATIVNSYEEITGGPDADWLNVDCEIVRNDGIIFSQIITISTYGAGAAHPNHEKIITNYSIETGKQLSLANLFKPGTNYLEIVTERTRFYLNRDHGVDPQGIIHGTSKESDLSGFMVENDGLKIGFDPYQVAPYSEGFIEILIPRSELGPNYLY